MILLVESSQKKEQWAAVNSKSGEMGCVIRECLASLNLNTKVHMPKNDDRQANSA